MITVFVLLIVLTWYGTRIKALTIDGVRIEGGETIDHSQLEVLVQEELEGLYLGIVPKRFVWFYPKDSIYESLKNIERIHNVSIKVIERKEITITFDEYLPDALWCDRKEGEKCLFIDETGFSFGLAPKLSGVSFLRFVFIGKEATINEFLVSTESYNDLKLLVDLLAGQKWFVSYVEIDLAGDAFLSLIDGGELKVTLDQSPEDTVENLITVVSDEKFLHIKPGNFKYIDLRYGNKVFVNEESVTIPEEGVTDENSSSTFEVQT